MVKQTYKKFFVLCEKSGHKKAFEVEYEQKIAPETCKELFEKDGYTVERVEPQANHHLCRYCYGIAEGTYKDLLCADCRSLFGHSLFSEL